MAAEQTIQFRVRYDEADQMGVAHHSRYLAWFELGRLELLRAAGLPPLEQEERGQALTLKSISVRYLAPARYDDLLELRTRVEEVREGEIVFQGRLFRVAVAVNPSPWGEGGPGEKRAGEGLRPRTEQTGSLLIAEAAFTVAAVTPDGATRAFSPKELAVFGGSQP